MSEIRPMDIKLVSIGSFGGDATAPYNVELSKELPTLREFIDCVLDKCSDEWGYMGIQSASGSIFGEPNWEYKKSSLVSSPPMELLDANILNVQASGGWSRMDYIIEVSR